LAETSPVTVKVKDIYKSKELWRGPDSIYARKHGQCVAHDKPLNELSKASLKTNQHGTKLFGYEATSKKLQQNLDITMSILALFINDISRYRYIEG
jgi:hypothetical protein